MADNNIEGRYLNPLTDYGFKKVFGEKDSKMGGISELSHMDSEERRKYFKSLNKYRTNLSVMEYAIEEGLQKKVTEIAKNAKDMGMEASVISKLTGLSVSEIESL